MNDDSDDDAVMRAAFARNREQMGDRRPAEPGWTAPMSQHRVEAVIAEAAKHVVTLDYSVASAAGVEQFIESWEHMARVACDLDDNAWVADTVAACVDLTALGIYYGELFVRHGGAAWSEAEGEDGLEPAVTRGGVTLLPITLVRLRVFVGPPLPLALIFARELQTITDPTAP